MDQEIDYVPTQIFTEFLKLQKFNENFYSGGPDNNRESYIDGLQFNSSLRENGKNLVLFKGPEISIRTNPDDEIWLSYQCSKTYKVAKVIVEAEAIS